MKTYSRFKTVEEIKAQCEAKGWRIDTTKYDRGDDFVTFDFSHGTDFAEVIFNGLNGRFLGKTDSGLKFSSDDNKDGVEWFDALLDFVYSSEAKRAAA